MRTPGAILSIAALYWSFLQAPFFHVHAGDLEHPAVSVPVHLHGHFAPHTPCPAILAQTGDDDAVEIEWGALQPQTVTVVADIAVPGKICVPAPAFSSVALSVSRPRGHDPPDLAPKRPRSPPA